MHRIAIIAFHVPPKPRAYHGPVAATLLGMICVRHSVDIGSDADALKGHSGTLAHICVLPHGSA